MSVYHGIPRGTVTVVKTRNFANCSFAFVITDHRERRKYVCAPLMVCIWFKSSHLSENSRNLKPPSPQGGYGYFFNLHNVLQSHFSLFVCKTRLCQLMFYVRLSGY